MGNPVVHWELMSKEPQKLAAFYEKLFGWKVEHRPELNYRIVDTQAASGINGGIVRPDREGPWPGKMLFYIAVDDLRFSLFTDPEGRMMGLWQGATS
jgi:predicted enzyme related to lactoylglutathione lyase